MTRLPKRILLADRLEQAMERAPRMGHYFTDSVFQIKEDLTLIAIFGAS